MRSSRDVGLISVSIRCYSIVKFGSRAGIFQVSVKTLLGVSVELSFYQIGTLIQSQLGSAEFYNFTALQPFNVVDQ